MRELERVTVCTGVGNLAAALIPKLWLPARQMYVTSTMIAAGYFQWNRFGDYRPFRFDQDGVVHVSPSPHEIANAIGLAGSDEIAKVNRVHWEGPAHRMLDRIVRAVRAQKLVDSQTVWVQGFRTGNRLPAEEILRELKKQVPGQFITALSTLPDDFDKRQRLREGYDFFVCLKNDGVVDTTILLDNDSVFARAFTLDVQDRYWAKALASDLAGQYHFAKNPSAAEISRSLGEYGAFVGMAFASRSISVSGEALGWGALERLIPGLPQRGRVDLASVILNTEEAIKQALTDPACLAIEETIDFGKPIFVICTIPLRLSMTWEWQTVSNEIRRWLKVAKYEMVIPVFASGNGTPRPGFPGSYWVQVSALFPMPDVPAPLQAIISGKEVAGQRQTHDQVTTADTERADGTEARNGKTKGTPSHRRSK